MSTRQPASAPPAAAPRTVACPVCGKKSVFEPWNPSRPFCSERYRTMDLGAWASESYRIPAKPGDDPAGGTQDPDA